MRTFLFLFYLFISNLSDETCEVLKDNISNIKEYNQITVLSLSLKHITFVLLGNFSK